jgi:hypothetical protein
MTDENQNLDSQTSGNSIPFEFVNTDSFTPTSSQAGSPENLDEEDFVVKPENLDETSANTVVSTTNADEQDQSEEPKEDAASTSEETDASEKEGGDKDFSDYTQTAMFATALKENGLDLFGEEFDKKVSPDQLITKISSFVDDRSTELASQQLAKATPYVDYVNFMIAGGKKEDVEPAMLSERYANMDLEDESVTEEHLEDLLTSMFTKQNVNEDLIPDMIEVVKSKGLLKEKASEAVKWHKDYIEYTKKQALEKYQRKQQEDMQKLQEESSKFVGVLNTGNIAGININKEDASKIYDFMYNRDQYVTYPDPETGQPTTGMVTKYEVAMYNAVNDPNKLALLAYIALNDFTMDKFKIAGKNNTTKQLYDAIEKKNVVQTQKQANTNKGSTNYNPVHSFTV